MDRRCDGHGSDQSIVLCFGVSDLTSTSHNLPLTRFWSVITGGSSKVKDPGNIAMLSIALILFPAFVYWMQRQENRGKPAIIPNSIWKNTAFTCSCISVFLTWGAFNPFGYFTTLLYVFPKIFQLKSRQSNTKSTCSFQEVQNHSALQTSLRFLPTVVCGILTNVATGLLVKHTKASYLVAVSSFFSATACALMAIVHPEWSFWACSFIAVFLSPMSSDGISSFSLHINFPLVPSLHHDILILTHLPFHSPLHNL